MARIPRVTAVPFGAGGTTDDFETFGSTAAGSTDFSKDIAAIQATDAWNTGWRPALITAKAPVMQDMNAKMLVDSNLLCYLFQEGAPEWDAGTTYYKGGLVKVISGTEISFYSSLTDGNINHTPPSRVSDSNWQFVYAATASGLIVPGLVGIIDASSVPSGDVGQTFRAYAGPVTPSTGVFSNVVSQLVPKGNWLLTAQLQWENNGSTLVDNIGAALSVDSGNVQTDHVLGDNFLDIPGNPSAAEVAATIANWEKKFTVDTTVYAKIKGTFTGSPQAYARLSGVRIS